VPTTGFFRATPKGTALHKTTTDANASDGASTKAHRTPAFRCWLCRSHIAPKDYHYLLRWEATPRVCCAPCLTKHQGSNGNRTGTRTPPKPGSQPVTPPRFATDHRLVSGRVSWCALQENPRSILATYKVSVCGSIAVSRLSAADPGFDKDQGV
jgi:hypothetical protein